MVVVDPITGVVAVVRQWVRVRKSLHGSRRSSGMAKNSHLSSLFFSPTADAPSRESGRRARPGANKRRNPNEDNDRGSPRRQSLRVGTGKKGRGAELSRRRGSLRKRDRSAEKEARAEARAERNTVLLPEYVL